MHAYLQDLDFTQAVFFQDGPQVINGCVLRVFLYYTWWSNPEGDVEASVPAAVVQTQFLRMKPLNWWSLTGGDFIPTERDIWQCLETFFFFFFGFPNWEGDTDI